MASVNVTNVVVLDNPAPATNPFQFEVTFECLAPLEDDLEWKVIYVGSAEDSSADQVLEEVMVGPVPEGVNRFVLQTNPPDYSLIKHEDIIGATIVLVTCSYRDNEFVRVGYYVVNELVNELGTPVGEAEPLPSTIDMSRVHRNVLADKPRITRFPINWSSGAADGALGYDMDGADQENAGDADAHANDAFAFSTGDDDGMDGMDDEDEEDDDENMDEVVVDLSGDDHAESAAVVASGTGAMPMTPMGPTASTVF